MEVAAVWHMNWTILIKIHATNKTAKQIINSNKIIIMIIITIKIIMNCIKNNTNEENIGI